MFFKMFVDLMFFPINALVSLLPNSIVSSLSSVSIPLPILYGANFFPFDLLVLVVSGFVLWYGVLMSWSVIEWLYKKIPGVD